MLAIHYRDLILRAAQQRDGRQLYQLVEQLADAERAREIFQAKGYGDTGMSTRSGLRQWLCASPAA